MALPLESVIPEALLMVPQAPGLLGARVTLSGSGFWRNGPVTVTDI